MQQLIQQLLLQVVLIGLNAFFAMTEIAVISLSPNKLKKMAEGGDRKAKKLLALVEEPSGFLSTIQIGITLAGFLASAFAADSFSQYLVGFLVQDLGLTSVSVSVLDTISVILITVILSYFTLVLGELTPKRIAMQKPMEVAKFSCGVVSILAKVMRPAILFLSFSTNAVLKVLHLNTEAQEETVTEEEIRMMVDLGEAKGAIEREEREWIENVFDFGDTVVGDVMVHGSDVVAFSTETSEEEVEETIRRTGLSRYPVYEKDLHHIVGILNARDFLLGRGEKAQDIRTWMRPAYFVPDTLKASILMQDLQKQKTPIAIVVDEYGNTAGLVTMEDLLEEIVGNIYDEFDLEEPEEIEQLEEGLWRVGGSAEIEEVAEALGLALPDDLPFDTLGGLVFSQLRTIPKDGTVFDVEAYGLFIHVEKIKDRRIVVATVRKVDQGKKNEEQ